jgi:hypothetical protein
MYYNYTHSQVLFCYVAEQVNVKSTHTCLVYSISTLQ